MLVIPSAVTTEADLTVHNQGVTQVTLVFKDAAGAVRDVSTNTLYFETSRGHRILLTNGGVTSEKVLTITQHALDTILDVVCQFIIVDETTGNHSVQWQGSLLVTGWLEGGTVEGVLAEGAVQQLIIDLAASTTGKGASLLGSIQSGTGAVAETAQTALRRVKWAEQFGALGDGVTNDTTALTNFFNSAIANPGLPHFMRASTYIFTSPLPVVNVSNVWIEGTGADIHDVGTNLITGTVLKYTGAATATPLVTITSVSGVANQRVSNVRFKGIGINCNSGCDYGLRLTSLMRCEIDVAVANAKIAGVDMTVIATLGETKDNQYNQIRLKLRQVEYSAYALRLGGDGIANTSLNEFWVDAQHNNTAAVVCTNSDNNDWRVVRCFKVGGGTATESIALLGSNTSSGSASREERFWAVTCNTTAHVYGTGTYTYPSINHQIFALDSDNSTPAPTIDAGGSMHWRYAKSALDDDAWIAYTPTITSGTGALTTVVSQVGYYRKFGKRVDFKLSFNITTNGTGATSLLATLPVAPAGSGGHTCVGKERNLTTKLMSGYIENGTSTVVIQYYDGTYPGATGGVYTLSGSYECAS